MNINGQEDALAAVNLLNAMVDGFDATETAPTATTMRSNYTQILSKTLKIAETTDAVKRYGRARETAYQLYKYSAEVKRDLEGIMLSGQAAAAGTSSTARKMASYQAMIDSGVVFTTGGASTAVTETKLYTALQTLYSNGADPSIYMIPPAEAKNLADYAAATGRYRTLENDASPTKIVNVVDVYTSPFGEIKVILNRFLLTTDHLIYDPEMWKQQVLRPWSRETLAKVGDSTRMLIVGEYSLKHKNQKASAYIRKTT